MLIDTHTHLDNEAFKDDIDEIIKKSSLNNVQKFIIPGTNIKCLHNALKIIKNYNNVFFALGFHPYDIEEWDKNIFDKYINDKKCVAIGECGIDYFRGDSNKDIQKDIFLRHINIAIENKKPLIIHIRDNKENYTASLDAKKILIENNSKDVGGVLHCFNANEDLLELVEHNFYFGIGGVVTFKNAKNLQEILHKIPLERIVLETDSPYLTPHPHRGGRNDSSYLPIILDKVSQILNIDKISLKNIIIQNTNRLFKLDS
jgi:TatD DNase family protein